MVVIVYMVVTVYDVADLQPLQDPHPHDANPLGHVEPLSIITPVVRNAQTSQGLTVTVR